MSTVYLIRHGQASFASDHYDQLSDVGVLQSEVLGQTLAQRLARPSTQESLPLFVAMGAMKRHAQTADACLAQLGHELTGHAVLPDLNEYNFEEVLYRYKPEYKDRSVLLAQASKAPNPLRFVTEHFVAAAHRWVGGQFDADYTESWEDFAARCVRGLQTVTAQLDKHQTALVFTSGGVISTIAQHCMGVSNQDAFAINWNMINASVSKLTVGRDGVRLLTLNEHAHFEGERAHLLTFK